MALLLAACGNNEQDPAATAEGDADAARMFVRSALNGNYKDAQRYMLIDSTNLEDLAQAERMYLRDSLMRQRSLRESSIIVHDIKKQGDSVSIVEFSNSFTKKRQAVKAVRVNGQWLIDFKYTTRQDSK